MRAARSRGRSTPAGGAPIDAPPCFAGGDHAEAAVRHLLRGGVHGDLREPVSRDGAT